MSRDHGLDARVITGNLHRCPFFVGFELAGLAKIAQLIEVRNVDPGRVLFPPGERGDALVIVALGSLELFVELDGNLRVIETVGPVTAFGELSLLMPGARWVGARSVEEATLYLLNHGTLRMLEQSDAPLAMQVVNRLRDRAGDALSGCRDMLGNLFVAALGRSAKGT